MTATIVILAFVLMVGLMIVGIPIAVAMALIGIGGGRT
jgi:hypothetical protein